MRRKGLRLTTVVLCVFLAQAALAARDYWVWVDDNGVTNFSEQKPKDRPARHVVEKGPYGYHETLDDARRPGTVPPPADTSPEQARAPGAQPKKEVNPDKLVADQKARLARQIAEVKRKNCEQARKNLQTLQRPRIRTKGADGQTRVMSPQEKQAQLDQAREAIRNNCGG